MQGLKQRPVWHYTIGNHLLMILESGATLPATAHVPPGERPIVWFSTNPYWEKTVTKGLLQSDGTVCNLGMRGMLNYGPQLFRIAVPAEAAPHNWPALRKLSGMNPRFAAGLARIARRWHAHPNEWRGTFYPVPSSTWISVEEFREKSWQPFLTRTAGDWVSALSNGVHING
jgi:hypothetical protein